MATKSLGKARYAASLCCLPKNAIVDKIESHTKVYYHINGKKLKKHYHVKDKFLKIDKNILDKLIVKPEISTSDEVMKVPLFLADTQKDIVDGLKNLVKFVKENNL